VGERRGRLVSRSYRQIDPERAELPGLVGEVGRHAGYVNWNLVPEIRTGEHLQILARLPASPLIRERGDAWLSGIPLRRKTSFFPVMHMELRLACWGGVLPYADPVSTRFRLYPLCDRRIIEDMVSLPPDYREKRRLGRDLVRRFWPELLAVPFNRYSGIRHVERVVKYTIWRWRSRLVPSR
jgi:hypothetical protein